MEIKIAGLKEDPVRYEEDLAPEFFDFADKDYIHFAGPSRVVADCSRVRNNVICHVEVESLIDSFCCRSLVPIERKWRIAFDLHYEAKSADQTIEIDDDIRQEVILNLPVQLYSNAEMEKMKKESAGASSGRAGDQAGEDGIPTYRPFEKLL